MFEDILAGVTGASLGEFNVVAVFDEKSKHNWEKIKSISKYSINDYNELL